MAAERCREGLIWQIQVWDKIARRDLRDLDQRFALVIEPVIVRAGLRPGQQVSERALN